MCTPFKNIGNTIDIEDVVSENNVPKPLNFIVDQEKMAIIVHEMLKTKITTPKQMDKFIVQMRRKYKVALGITNILYSYRLMIQNGTIEPNIEYEELLKAKVGRAYNGVMVISVVTSPYPKSGEIVEKFSCPHNCFYCPDEPGQPRSYLKEEPGVMRANRNDFDAILQFRDRATAYIINGHPVDKVELIILGGTWSSYKEDYKNEFIRDLYYAANTLDVYMQGSSHIREPLSLEEEQLINETAECSIIGLTIETRPDKITRSELINLRKYQVTRVQLGVQHTDDNILELVNRECKTRVVVRSVKNLKNECFKIDGHLMPDLPGSNPDIDKDMLTHVVNSPDLQFDQLKIYPCAVVPYTEIKKWHENGTYKPYAETKITFTMCKIPELNNKTYKVENNMVNIKDSWYSIVNNTVKIDNKIIDVQLFEKTSNPLIELLIYFKSIVPPWVRLNRIVRDIPNTYISGGNNVTNLRQIITDEMKHRGESYGIEYKCKCIRCREVKKQITDVDNAVLKVRHYKSSGGDEYFISFENPDETILYGFCRLRLSEDAGKFVFSELKGCALIRELHVYGKVVCVNTNNNNHNNNNTQHRGFGKLLLTKAEAISLENNYTKAAVISGVGVKNYYRKLGYNDDHSKNNKEYKGNFLIKNLNPINDNNNIIFIKSSNPRMLQIYLIIFMVLIYLVLYFMYFFL
jgi:histone acetyltransferase (RNA polymerase elongator complex component)